MRWGEVSVGGNTKRGSPFVKEKDLCEGVLGVSYLDNKENKGGGLVWAFETSSLPYYCDTFSPTRPHILS